MKGFTYTYRKNNINENKNANNTNQKGYKFTLKKSIRILVYILLLVSSIFINISSGIFPSSSIDIKTYLNINDYQFGHFILYSSIGKILGSLIFFTIKKKINRKYLFILTTSINAIIMIVFQFSKLVWLFSISKGIMGITDMLIQIITPIWIQQFGFTKYKLNLNSIIQLSNPLGKILAFWANYYLSWLSLFKIGGIFFGIIFISFIIIPNQYTSKNIIILIDNETGEELIDKRSEKNVTFYMINEDYEEESNKNIPLLDKNNNKNNNENELNNNLNINDIINHNGNKKIIHLNNNISIYTRIKMIFSNKLFMISLIIRTLLIGIQSSISFWAPDIMIRLIEIKKKSFKNLLGNILIIITPPLGNFICRIIGNFSLISHKKKKKIVLFIILFYIVSFLCCIFISDRKSFSFVATIILFLFFSSVCLPMLHGICISSINKKLKDNIFSFIHVFTLFFGSGLIPFIFGFFYEKKEKNKIIKIKHFLYCCLGVGFFLMPFLIYFIFRKEFNDNERNDKFSIRSKGFSIDSNKKNGGEGIVQELANAYGDDITDIVKKKKKTQLKSIDI